MPTSKGTLLSCLWYSSLTQTLNCLLTWRFCDTMSDLCRGCTDWDVIKKDAGGDVFFALSCQHQESWCHDIVSYQGPEGWELLMPGGKRLGSSPERRNHFWHLQAGEKVPALCSKIPLLPKSVGCFIHAFLQIMVINTHHQLLCWPPLAF